MALATSISKLLIVAMVKSILTVDLSFFLKLNILLLSLL